MKTRLKEKYNKEVIPYFLSKENFNKVLEVPRLEKVVINTSLGRSIENSKILEKAQEVLANITGQKSIKTIAKKSISSFKLREGMAIGAKVTLRQDKMFEFIDRLISVALPRIRDFRGLEEKAFDGRGNYNIGLEEVTVFPEAQNEEDNFGLEISIVTTARNNEDAKEVLEKLGFPFKKKTSQEGENK